jgi:hypothetical protein
MLKEENMVRKKGKSVSFDAMVKFFLQQYGIPTKKDVDKLMARMDRLEKLIKASSPVSPRRRKPGTAPSRTRPPVAAYESVLAVIKRSRKGTSFADIQAKTGFNEKKIRNIIFRLNKLKKIKRKSRGVYIAV